MAFALQAQLITPGLQFGSGPLTFSTSAGGLAPAQEVPITCLGATGAFTASASSSGGWLSLTPTTGATPSTVTVSVHTAGLAPGSYTGSITAIAPGSCGSAPPLLTTLMLNPAPGGAYTVSPSALSFTYPAGAIPTPQTVLISGGSAQAFTVSAASPAGWLALTPLRASPPATLTATVNPSGLNNGIYAAEIILAPVSGPSQRIPVTLTVTGGPAPVTEPIVFTHQAGGPAPVPRSVSVPAGPFLVAATSDGNWLAASPYDQAQPSNVTLTANPSGLALGSYSGNVRVSYAGGLVETIPVVLDVVSNVPRLSSILNGGSHTSSPIAPGEILTIRGSGLGPAGGLNGRVVSGIVTAELGGVRVLVNGAPAPLLYASDTQVNFIAPFSIAGRTPVSIEVEYQGRRSIAASFSVQDASPAIFTADSSGRGQAALLNEDTSLNFDLNPADRGRIAVLYANGAGLMSPPAIDGEITGFPLAAPILPVSVLVDGQEAQVIYSGSAPGIVAGVLQVNFRVPLAARAGPAIGLLLKAGRFTSQTGVTMAIR